MFAPLHQSWLYGCLPLFFVNFSKGSQRGTDSKALLGASDISLQHWKPSISWSASDNIFPRGSCTM